jgi:DNA-binding MarR family transcriptional regulator
MNSLELSSSLRATISALHKVLRKQSPVINEYSMTERETISLLTRNPYLSPTELAELTKVKSQSMSTILNKLEDQDIIRRTPSKDDKRKIFVSLTPHGKKVVEKAKHEWDQQLRTSIEKSLSEKEREALIKILPVFKKLIENI